MVLQLNRVGNRNHLDEEEEEKVVERKGDSWGIDVTYPYCLKSVVKAERTSEEKDVK